MAMLMRSTMSGYIYSWWFAAASVVATAVTAAALAMAR